jgi:molybdate transport system substrate-binding protein
LIVPFATSAAQASVAVAANFTAPMQRIAAAFERDTGHRLKLAFGATGKFYAQVVNGAPFDVLLAADDETPARLVREKHAMPASQVTYAIGRLVLWSAQPGTVYADGNVLRKAAAGKLAVAEPKLSPYGAAALETMAALGVLPQWRGALVRGESIAQALQFVATGNARLGFVALSQVMAGGRIEHGSAWVVPSKLHAPLKQDAVLLVPGRDNPAAVALLQYLRGDTARAVMRAHGYEHGER